MCIRDRGRVLLKLHGGGYVQGLHDRHRQMGVNQAVLTEGQSLYMVHYRLAPEYHFPATLEDAFKAYESILNQGVEPENIIVIGDSAGGNLALEPVSYTHLPAKKWGPGKGKFVHGFDFIVKSIYDKIIGGKIWPYIGVG